MTSFTARRDFLAAVASLAATALSGCAGMRPWPCDTPVGDPAGPLTLDVHSHVFNGTDLQVENFLRKVVARSVGSELRGLVDGLGPILEFLGWNLAPGAVSEEQMLRHAGPLFSCGPTLKSASLDAARQDGYERGRNALLEAKNRALVKRATTRKDLALSSSIEDKRLAETHDAIEALLPPKYEDWKLRRDASRVGGGLKSTVKALRSEESFTGYIDFVLHHFNYRHVNVLDYFETYSLPSRRKIDLLVPSLVDFDYWLNMGSATPSTLEEQVRVMERISIASAGRVHGFVAFCPFREVMTRGANATGESLELVKDAILNRGFIGVKLYPPMGFAPFGNCGRTDWKGDHSLPAISQDPDFGCKLDSAMEALFRWCEDERNDVPVMAHTNHSNGPNPQYEDLAGADYWAKALDKFKGLRVSFGHFGDTDMATHNGARTRKFIELMTSGAGSAGERAFADSGFFSDVLTQPGNLRSTLAALYNDAGTTSIAERFMYGTDWEMVLTQNRVDEYFKRFIDVMDALDANPARPRGGKVSEAFFGTNAAVFLGLPRGGRNRDRLEAFYAKNGVATPDWMTKVDRSGVAPAAMR